MIDDWVPMLKAELDGMEPPHDLWDRSLTREPHEAREQWSRSTQRLASGVVAFVLVSGVALGAWFLLGQRAGEAAPPAVDGPQGEVLTNTQPYEDDLLQRGWAAVQEEVRGRLDAWATEVAVGEMSIEEPAAAMDVITSAISSRDELQELEQQLRWLELRELMSRRDLLCHRLPVDHSYRGGEYCD
jgi:hypothetical protein